MWLSVDYIHDSTSLRVMKYLPIHCKILTEWLPWLAGDGGVERFVLVIEVNCISNLSLNYTLQLTTLSERVTTTAFQKYDAFVVILSQMFRGSLYLQDDARSLIHAGFLSGCLMQLANN